MFILFLFHFIFLGESKLEKELNYFLEKNCKYYEDSNGFFEVYYGEAYCKAGNISKAKIHFEKMEKKLETLKEKKIQFDESHYRNIFKAFIKYYCEKEDLVSVLEWKKKLISRNLADISTFNIILEFLLKKNEKEMFFYTFKEMFELDVIPDDHSFSFLFSILADNFDFNHFYQFFHCFIVCGTSVISCDGHPLSYSLLPHLKNSQTRSIIFQLLKSCKDDHPLNVSDIKELIKNIKEEFQLKFEKN